MLSSSASARDLTFERETKYLEGFRGVSEQSRAFPGSQTEARWIRFLEKSRMEISYNNRVCRTPSCTLRITAAVMIRCFNAVEKQVDIGSWASGRLAPSHGADPGSIPGGLSFFFLIISSILDFNRVCKNYASTSS